MLNRLTISTLLKSAVALCGAAVITLLAFSVSDSWGRLRTASRAAAATQASTDLFMALHNLRIDNSTTYRDLMSDDSKSQMIPMLRDARAAEMPALRSGIEMLRQLDLPGQREMVDQLSQQV